MLSRKGRIYDGMLCSSTTARLTRKSPCAAMPSHSQTLKTKVGNALAQSTMRTAAGHAFKTECDACEKARCCIPTCSAAALLMVSGTRSAPSVQRLALQQRRGSCVLRRSPLPSRGLPAAPTLAGACPLRHLQTLRQTLKECRLVGRLQ